VRAVIDNQASRAQRRACADAVIFNDGITTDQLANDVNTVWRRWT
jgi:dephospho-CoA kinase